MTTYIALLRKDEASDFGVDFPDFPGCVTAGGTLQEASAMAREALRGHIALMLEEGEAIPDPAPLDAVMAESENRDAMPFLVEIQTTRPKTVRVNITLPEPVLAEIDAYAAAHGFTRSGFLVHAARRAMDIGEAPARSRKAS